MEAQGDEMVVEEALTFLRPSEEAWVHGEEGASPLAEGAEASPWVVEDLSSLVEVVPGCLPLEVEVSSRVWGGVEVLPCWLLVMREVQRYELLLQTSVILLCKQTAERIALFPYSNASRA